MRRPLILATALLLAAHALFVLEMAFRAERGALGFLPWAAIPIAAFIAATIEQKRKILAEVLVAAPAAMLFVISNAAAQWFGLRVTFPGPEGAMYVFAMSLPTSAALAATGAGLAHLSPYHPI